MPDIFSFPDLQRILAAKLCLVGFLFFGVILIWKEWKPYIFLVSVGVFSALAYFLFTQDLHLMLFGLQGDEITIAAMYEVFSEVSLFSDFAYLNLPPFYPPLFFWVFSWVGRFWNMTSVEIGRIAAIVSILLYPICVYLAQKLYWKYSEKEDKKLKLKPSLIAWLLAPLIAFVFIDWSSIILKPYELIAGTAAIFWTTFLVLDFYTKRLNWKRILTYGLSGGVIFMTYYLWLLFGGIAIALYGLWVKKERQWRFYFKIGLTFLITLLIASPFLVPLLQSYQIHGTENWQMALMTQNGISLFAPFFSSFSIKSLLMLAGFATLIWFRDKIYIKILLLMFATSYLWQFMEFFNIYFFKTPIQGFKGFYFFNRIILATALAFGVEKLWLCAKEKLSIKNWTDSLKYVGLFFLSTQLFFGFFIDDPKIQKRAVESKHVEERLANLSSFLNSQGVESQPLTLHSGIEKLHAFYPVNTFIYFNQHNSHPAAGFSSRKRFVRELSLANDSDEFYTLTQNNKYGEVDRLIFTHDYDADTYNIHFIIDDFPNASGGEIIKIPRDLISEKYFKKVYSNSRYVVFEDKNNINEQE